MPWGNSTASARMGGDARTEANVDLRIPEGDFGDLNWKGYALILRLHYKDHARQIQKALAPLPGPA